MENLVTERREFELWLLRRVQRAREQWKQAQQISKIREARDMALEDGLFLARQGLAVAEFKLYCEALEDFTDMVVYARVRRPELLEQWRAEKGAFRQQPFSIEQERRKL